MGIVFRAVSYQLSAGREVDDLPLFLLGRLGSEAVCGRGRCFGPGRGSRILSLFPNPGLLACPSGIPASPFLRARGRLSDSRNTRPRKKDERRPTASAETRLLTARPWGARCRPSSHRRLNRKLGPVKRGRTRHTPSEKGARVCRRGRCRRPILRGPCWTVRAMLRIFPRQTSRFEPRFRKNRAWQHPGGASAIESQLTP